MSEKMRDILFRGKRKDNGEWIRGSFWDEIPGALGGIAQYGSCVFHHVDLATLGQFTGLFDKNGKKIFEGDIIEAIASNPVGEDIEATAIVSLDDYELMWDIEHSHEIEVIGNIHDNPELLKEATNV